MPWKLGPNGGRLFVPKGKFERLQAELFWAGFKGGISARAMQALKEHASEPIRLTVQNQPPSKGSTGRNNS
jgi:hypothetical protein